MIHQVYGIVKREVSRGYFEVFGQTNTGLEGPVRVSGNLEMRQGGFADRYSVRYCSHLAQIEPGWTRVLSPGF